MGRDREHRYRDIARTSGTWWPAPRYVIGGAGNTSTSAPDTVAAELSNFTCENCVSYNLLKLTRLLHFHQPQPDRPDRLLRAHAVQPDAGGAGPNSPHGFNFYYTGLSPGAFKQQPLNYFPHGDPDAYATNYDTFTCDTATGMETQAKFADTIYSRDDRGIYVNLFVSSEVPCTDRCCARPRSSRTSRRPGSRCPARPLTLRVRIPAWVAGRRRPG